MNKNIALIGLGPHAKRIYLNYFKKHKVNLALVVDLNSKKESTMSYLKEKDFKNTKFFGLSDEYKDNERLPEEVASNLLSVCKTLEVTHIIISTEPKAHNMYVEFALRNNYDVLTDKPITVNKNMTSIRSINKTRKQYYNILQMAENSKSMCKVMCQRQYHRGYEYIKDLLNEIVLKYQVPITYIDIYHCDGNWEMPHDLNKENHPYKYGYGKLFHSGYHFIDLLSDFIKINNQLSDNKRIVSGTLVGDCFTPNDELEVFNINDYKRIFKNQEIPSFYDIKKLDFKKYGEKNFYGKINFKNSHGAYITHVNLNLLHYGFSRRGWIESKDYYKNNGRIRHEHINIHIGTLMNIQVHSYQSKEIKDRTKDFLEEEKYGGLEHFDIDIYRNTDIIGGEPYQRISLGNLYKEEEKKNILGYNELSREQYLTNFLSGKCEKGDIKDQALAIEILYSCAKQIHNYYNHKYKEEKIDLKNDNIYPNKIKELKRYSYNTPKDKKKNKHVIDLYECLKDEYEYSTIISKLDDYNTYQVYLSVGYDNAIASTLLYKEIKSYSLAKIYYNILKIYLKHVKINKIIKLARCLNKKSES